MKTEDLLPPLQGHAIGPWPDPHKSTSSLNNFSFSLSQSNISNCTYIFVFRVISLFFGLNLLALQLILHALSILSITLITFYEDYKAITSTLCNFFHNSVDTIFEVPNCIKILFAAWNTKYLNRQVKEADKTSPSSKIYLFICEWFI
jgi:hypothetical protein